MGRSTFSAATGRANPPATARRRPRGSPPRTQPIYAGIIACSCAWEKREITAEHGCDQNRARHGGMESQAVTSLQWPADRQKHLTEAQSHSLALRPPTSAAPRVLDASTRRCIQLLVVPVPFWLRETKEVSCDARRGQRFATSGF